ncbi:ribonuclease D [Nakamurella panacisegetis]|uniref:Ribonuclease D n=1 Tax=Nakamurella panacisegetis TaxID=1090615 RepID=A0A1H0QKM3_9ACTN|nr:ribonuclease D [Nakamurella panacisegetis]SDP17228.1 ribonuclease D [Nakamurella panacisegetis]
MTTTSAADGVALDREPDDAPDDGATPVDTPVITPLLVPRDGHIEPVVDPLRLAEWARRLSLTSSPVALDAERASGYRYGSRAYLVQLRRPDVGTILFDPIALGDLAVLDQPLAGSEWVLHAASQDLPCLAEIGMRPRTLFDTELAGRLAGLPRVGLGPLVEQMLGLGLAKGHGAADWSTRPLPAAWLTYAALDVEVLIELRDAMEQLLASQGKLEWAREEFAAIVAAPPTPPRVDPWRRTSGIHKLRDPRVLAIVRELWITRDTLARRRDLAPHRVLPDTAIVAAASAKPTSIDALVAMPVFTGRVQRRQAGTWWDAIRRAMALPASELPPPVLAGDGPPPPAKWALKDPKAAARLTAARTALAGIAERVSMPVENLISPDLVRRTMWSPPAGEEVAEALRAGGARPWQIELTGAALRTALDAPTA